MMMEYHFVKEPCWAISLSETGDSFGMMSLLLQLAQALYRFVLRYREYRSPGTMKQSHRPNSMMKEPGVTLAGFPMLPQDLQKYSFLAPVKRTRIQAKTPRMAAMKSPTISFPAGSSSAIWSNMVVQLLIGVGFTRKETLVYKLTEEKGV